MRPPSKVLIAARLMLGQTQAELAEASGLAIRTIYNLEHASGYIESAEDLMHHFSQAGITFVEPDGRQGWGVFNLGLLESYDDERRRVRLENAEKKAAAALEKAKLKGV